MNYVLITPARNEAAFLELTIQSVVSQTVRPVKWVIVSDGSTDGTDKIVQKYAAQHDWIELVCMPERRERHFAGKVAAFNAGYARVKELPYALIGNLDADISFDRDYFSFLLSKFQLFPQLGVAGTAFNDPGHRYNYALVGLDHVSGGCQMFRRECFEAIGGYIPVKGGGIDLIAVTTARMRGWQTRTFTERVFEHHRMMGSASENAVMAKFRLGEKDYRLGGHPLWELFRALYQLRNPPLLFGGSALLMGYLWAGAARQNRPVSREFIKFRHHEQMRRLRKLLRGSSAGTEPVVSVGASAGGAALPAAGVPGANQTGGGYVLVTAARDEAAFIEKTIQSVVAQTIRPVRWMIVSDGSTDGTDEIVKRYTRIHDWIELLPMPQRPDRNLGGKAHAFNAGWIKLQPLAFDFIANLDADISFEPDYFHFLLSKFQLSPSLGLVGTSFTENGGTYDYRFVSLEHVSGQCQLFRRECFEQIGGYVPVKGGGIDVIAVTTARMNGWRTRTFLEKSFEHHRLMGTASAGILTARFQAGQKDYALGGHFLWETLRAGFQFTNKPWIVGGCMILAGYMWSAVRRVRRPVSREFVRFRRRDQMQRLVTLMSPGKRAARLTLASERSPTPWPDREKPESRESRAPKLDLPCS